MSGHSKWTQIKRQKGALDIKRGQAFTKLANAITIAVHQGGGIADPAQNFKLRLVIEKARQINMPKENIERGIERGLGKGEKGGLEEAVYEGFGPSHVAVIVEAATDNKQRTMSEIRQIFQKFGGSLASVGAVSYQFEQKGLISVKKDGKSTDDIFLLAAEAGASDLEEANNEVLVYTNPDELSKVKDALSKDLEITDAQLFRKPTALIAIVDKAVAEKLLSFMDKLEELDDVLKVYSNFDIPNELLSTLNK